MTDGAALTVEGVVAGYGGVPVLDEVDVFVSPGTIMAVLGANGAGKTTLLRTISGFVRPRSGRVLVDGTDLARRRPEDVARAGVAHVPEGQGVVTELTVEENLRLGGLARRDRPPGPRGVAGPAGVAGAPWVPWAGGSARAARSARAAALRETYQRFPVLAQKRRAASGDLSGGERQILVIARALMAAPRVLLLDEPSLGLAPRIVTQVMDLVRQLRDEAGLTVLLVEQNARSALAIADAGIVLNLGRVVAAADAAALAADVGLRRHYLGF